MIHSRCREGVGGDLAPGKIRTSLITIDGNDPWGIEGLRDSGHAQETNWSSSPDDDGLIGFELYEGGDRMDADRE